jgi:diguanylate cyclase (GGDEF)-like protein/PAS domain S-box-containing protein
MNPPRPPTLPIDDLLEVLPDAVLMVDQDGRILYANSAVRPLLGYAPDDLVGEALALLIPPEFREQHASQASAFHRNGRPTRMGARPMLQALRRDGTRVAVSISLCHWPLEDGRRVSVAVLHDVGDLHSHVHRANQLAETDALTGVGNRLRLSREMQHLLSGRRPFAVLYLDLRHFKRLNDERGHAAGDEALQVVARRLLGQVREGDLVARLGGDEFVVLLPGLDDEDMLADRAGGLAKALAHPLSAGGVVWELGVNIGGAQHPRHGRDEATLLAAADRAMYRAKQAGLRYRLADG